jgi:anion-transporting  ArsA/GET3 family ATPase
MTTRPIEAALDEARVIVSVGTGGVGKTTIAAALAVEAARRGRRTLVLTIDPARRLANAFGLEALGDEPVRIALEPDTARTSEGGANAVAAPHLEVMMLSTQHAFDQLVLRLTSDPEVRRRILDNRIYQHLAQALAGSSEYAAMAEVQALVETGRYDLIVVDTPPAEHALDFLRAPARLQSFLESRFFHALVLPAMSASRLSLRLFARPLHRALGLLERIAGLGFLEDLTELLRALDGLSDDLSARARAIQSVLFGNETRFVLVCRALAGSTRSTEELISGFGALGARLAALVVNRMQPWHAETSPAALLERCRGEAFEADLRALARALGPATDAGDDRSIEAAKDASPEDQPERVIVGTILDHARVCALEAARFDALAEAARRRGIGCSCVAERATPLDRLDGLVEIASQLTSDEPRG